MERDPWAPPLARKHQPKAAGPARSRGRPRKAGQPAQPVQPGPKVDPEADAMNERHLSRMERIKWEERRGTR